MSNQPVKKEYGRCKSTSRFLFFISVLLFCSFYVLYKSVIIDEESVLKHNSQRLDSIGLFGSQEPGSLLRSANPAEQDPISKSARWDQVARSDGGVRIAYICDNCDKPSQFYGIAYLTKKNGGGLKVVVLVNYTSERDINIGTAEAVIMASYGKVLALNQTLELCAVDEELLKCPIKKGFQSFRREVALPRFAPKGRYHGTASLRFSDTKQTELCAKGSMVL